MGNLLACPTCDHIEALRVEARRTHAIRDGRLRGRGAQAAYVADLAAQRAWLAARLAHPTHKAGY